MGYVQRVPTKFQTMLPMIPKFLDKIPTAMLRMVGLDITEQQRQKLAILEQGPAAMLGMISPEVLHSFVAATCAWLEHLLEMDRQEGIGTGNGHIGSSEQLTDTSSRGESERKVNADGADGQSVPTTLAQSSDALH
jgi:hypothetical protein